MRITGTMFYYYFVCKRKLWYFINNITLEKENDNVLLGKLLDESSYGREDKQILIDETVNIDFIRDWKVLHEIKKSKSIEEASIWQVKYYLYFLNQRDIQVEKGVLDYPKLKQRKEIYLEKGDTEQITNILKDIEHIASQEISPPIIHSKICKACAYYEFCYI
ncbi:CRISPR-associated protein Cas4 [Cellulosilyticum sp. I15G10I2]|uniref:CRISPR-associated protein Cas4 n=1 Tax=Cellulosilyticum sp. I15G10I2 TaxID=1892843 RepID=UPI00085C998B|nr:CRISPR-associated protein Cas4 [Cellulosilyticum sp. I15G10I2]